MNECLFCRIIKGEIPSKIVFRNEFVLAFHDINPQAPVHLLVVPIKHVENLKDPKASDSSLLVPVFNAIREISDSFPISKGFRVVVNCGREGGQTVDHLHFHLLGGRPMSWPPG
ncbi:histidine triad nucleotide-binding protein [bacterium]|nr:histidine triad nucleotide-binding protein [bacterium]